MEKYLVTGATGHLGRLTIEALLKRVAPEQIVGLARDPLKAEDLIAHGIEVRAGDYGDPASLDTAMKGIDKLMFISTAMFQDTVTQHRNIVASAKNAGIKHIVYTGIQRRDGSGFTIDMVSETERATEEALFAAGIPWTILRNSLYLDSMPLIFGADVAHKGIIAPAGDTPAALGARADFAEANAVVLTSEGHADAIYTLGASAAARVSDMAEFLGELFGHPVAYRDVDRASFIAERAAEGLPDFVADFLAQWAEAIKVGEFEEVTGDLERLIGRRPKDYRDVLSTLYAETHAPV